LFLEFSENNLGQNHKKKESKSSWKIIGAYLPNMPLTKNQRHKNYFKAVLGKYALRTQKKHFFSFGKNLTNQTCLL